MLRLVLLTVHLHRSIIGSTKFITTTILLSSNMLATLFSGQLISIVKVHAVGPPVGEASQSCLKKLSISDP